jgi:hypothetical protein
MKFGSLMTLQTNQNQEIEIVLMWKDLEFCQTGEHTSGQKSWHQFMSQKSAMPKTLSSCTCSFEGQQWKTKRIPLLSRFGRPNKNIHKQHCCL